MTRSTRVLLPLVALVIAASTESGPSRPQNIAPSMQQPGVIVITGVVALVEEPAPHLALQQGEIFIPLVGNTADLDGKVGLVPLVGNTADLDGKVGLAIKAAGSFREDGAFDMVQYWLANAPEAVAERAAKP